MPETEEPKPKSGWGGARAGSGRKPKRRRGPGGSRKGIPNKITQGHRARLANAGQPDPVDLLVFKANFYAARAQRLIQRQQSNEESVKQSQIDDALDRMEAAAVKAAPYFRSKLSTLTVEGGLRLDLSKATDEQLDLLERLIRDGVAVPRGHTGGAETTRH